ncbi:hypothetical protein EON79_03510 [bacterium]|nr:MAG: hypothetical protein EON79_03510 [bacterium]
MSSRHTTYVAPLVAAACGLAVFGGARLRDAADLGARPLTDPSSLVASRGATIQEGDYFDEVARLLEREYVEPITDEQKLATGAVRGMIASLNDPKSLFMDKAAFTTFLDARSGKYQGIGADLVLEMRGAINAQARPDQADPGETSPEATLATQPRVPRLIVASLVPGGPADKAGVKVGDAVYEVDKHWVVNTDLLVRYQKAARDWEAKKISTGDFNKIREEVRAKTERALLPLKAKEKLTQGAGTMVEVVWERGGAKQTMKILKAASQMPASGVKEGVYTLRFNADAPAALKEAAGQKTLTIDLRQNSGGDYETMRKCLEAVAPKGTYGEIRSDRGAPTPFVVKTGTANPPKMTLLVDGSTRGAAEIFALALESQGRAKLVGTKTAGDRTITQIVMLPDGSGYTLATGEYAVAKKGGKS